MIEQAASVISEDNTELACAFIQKTAVEKALPEMDKRLTTVQFFWLVPSVCAVDLNFLWVLSTSLLQVTLYEIQVV